MSAASRRVPANLVQPGWSVRLSKKWWHVIMVAETEHTILGRRVWLHVLDRDTPIIVLADEEVEVQGEDPSSQAK